jgi:hypothetical protein
MSSDFSSARFTVIDGGGQKPSAWLDIPQAILGLSPESRKSQCGFRISTEGVRKALSIGNRQPLLDLWALVIGEIPPVNGARMKWKDSLSDLQSFSGAVACFRGIKRPVGNDDTGFDTYAYVTRPKTTFKYAPSLSCVVQPVSIPEDIVCVTYVRFDHPVRRPVRSGDKALARGIITGWELVEADPVACLPIEWETRYRKQMW